MKNLPALTASMIWALGSTVLGVTLSQPLQNVGSGSLNYGQQFGIDSGSLAGTTYGLETISLVSGNGTYDGYNTGLLGSSAAVYLDIYEGLLTDAPRFANPATTTQLTYLGSSSNSVNYAAARAFEPLLWSFRDIEIVVARTYFAVLSQDGVDGNWVGMSLMIGNNRIAPGDGSDELPFSNTSTEISNPLFQGDPAVADPFQDNTYAIELSLIPEPHASLLSALGALFVLQARRRHTR